LIDGIVGLSPMAPHLLLLRNILDLNYNGCGLVVENIPKKKPLRLTQRGFFQNRAEREDFLFFVSLSLKINHLRFSKVFHRNK
jgi:hypothetical protein